MDEYGALFFLGTQGGKRLHQNPAQIGQVKVFSSTIGAGDLNEFVGRNVTNLRTFSEKNSYLGVDLGPGRKLLPTAYTIKNRNSSSHACLSWLFEGSNDKVIWKILDKRIFHTGNEEYDDQFSQVVKTLCKSG